MIKGFSIAILLLALIGCEDRSSPMMGNSFIRDFLLKINHLGGESLSMTEDEEFVAAIKKAKEWGEEVNSWLQQKGSKKEFRILETEKKWQELLSLRALDESPKRNLLNVALLAYLSHLKGLEILFFPEDKDRKVYELQTYASSFSALSDTLLQSAESRADIRAALRELRQSLNTMMIDVRYWPSRLSLPLDEYRQWFRVFKKGDLEGYYGQYFHRILMLKDRIFNVRVLVDEKGQPYRPESIKNDFNQDYDLGWQTDLEMADLQIKHFLWIRNELEVMKEALFQDQASLEEMEQAYEPLMLGMIIDRMILKYGRLLLSDLKWAILEEIKANGSGKLRKRILKEEEPRWLSQENHEKFMNLISAYESEVEQRKDFLKEEILLKASFSFDRLVKAVARYEESVRSHRRSPLFVLEDRPQWQSFWKIVY